MKTNISLSSSVTYPAKRTGMSAASFGIMVRQAFLQSTVFRANFLIGLLSDLLFVYLSIQVWTALYDHAAPGGTTIAQLITFVTLARIVAPIDMEFVQQTQQRVLSGEIVGELIKPVPLFGYMLAQEIGRYANKLLMRVLPISACIYVLVGLTLPTKPVYIAMFILSVALSFWLMFTINYITALAAFWITQLFSINVLKGQTVRLLSGVLVPLWFFPPSFLPILKLLPFASVAFIPVQLFLEQLTVSEALLALLIQFSWGIVFFLIGKWMWSRAVRQITVNGG